MASLGGFLPPVIIEIMANAKEAIAQFEVVNTELGIMGIKAEKTGLKLDIMTASARYANIAFKALAAGALLFSGYAVEAGLKSEEVFARLNTALKDSGNSSVETQKQFKELSEANAKLGFTTDETATALGTLVTATRNTKDSQKLLATAMDYARYKHISLSEAATTLARGTQGSVKAFKEMGITLDKHLPKQEAINKAFDELNKRIGGQNQAYLNTFAGKVSVLKAQFQLLAEKLGEILIPILTKVFDFIGKHAKVILIVVGAITALLVAYKAWMLATKAVAAAQTLLNVVLDANPISLIIIAVAALIGLFVLLWNKCDTFRKIVVDVAQAVIHYVAQMVSAWGELITTILNIIEGPLKLFLEVMSHLPGVGKYAKEGLDFIQNGIKGIGDFADSTAKKLDNTANSLDKLKNKKITAPKLGGSGTGATPNSSDPYSLDNYSGGAGGAGGGGTAINQNITIYASNTNDIYKQLSKAAQTGLPIGAK